MKHETQIALIRKSIISCINEGATNKIIVYDKVSRETNIARPTIRRVAHVLRKELISKIEILESNIIDSK